VGGFFASVDHWMALGWTDYSEACGVGGHLEQSAAVCMNANHDRTDTRNNVALTAVTTEPSSGKHSMRTLCVVAGRFIVP